MPIAPRTLEIGAFRRLSLAVVAVAGKKIPHFMKPLFVFVVQLPLGQLMASRREHRISVATLHSQNEALALQ